MKDNDDLINDAPEMNEQDDPNSIDTLDEESDKNEKSGKQSEKREKSGVNATDSLKSDEVTKSPVVEKQSKLKSLANNLILLVLAAFLTMLIVLPSHKSHTNDNLPPTDNAANDDIKPPSLGDDNQLPLSATQIQKLKAQNNNLNNNATPDPQAINDAVKAVEERMSAQSQVYNADNAGTEQADSGSTDNSGNKTNNNAVLGGDGSGDANTQFMAKVSQSSAPTSEATRIVHASTTLAQGNIIQATLETRIDSDLPGMVRAVTSQDIYSEDDSTVLIPRGSRLIGQYTNAISQGQNRIFVVWQRLIRPDNIDIQISSPGSDPLGGTGFAADSIDHHFYQQFGTAILLSVIGATAANAGVSPSDQYNSIASYRSALADSFNQTAQQNLQNTGVIPPTLVVNQGDKISIFVARDLDFYDALNGKNDVTQGNSSTSLFQGNLES